MFYYFFSSFINSHLSSLLSTPNHAAGVTEQSGPRMCEYLGKDVKSEVKSEGRGDYIDILASPSKTKN